MSCPRVPSPRTTTTLVAPVVPGERWASTGQAAARRRCDLVERRDPDAPFGPVATSLHDLPDDVRAAALRRGEPRRSGRPFRGPWPLAAWPAVPTRVLIARHDRRFPHPLLADLARKRLGVETDPIDGGHLPALGRPEEVAGWLEHGAAAGRLQRAAIPPGW